MLKKLLKNKEFLKIIKEFLGMPKIMDVVLFGSITRGKELPKDVDILILYHDSKDIININYMMKKKLKHLGNFQIIGKTYDEIFKPEFFARESILSEGFSLKQNNFFSELLGYRTMIMFKYSLKGMNKSKRMTFYYSLHGRGNEKGVLERNNWHKFSDSIILSPLENSENLKAFFMQWGIQYIELPVIISKRAKSLK